jgi:condensin complex subunit 2
MSMSPSKVRSEPPSHLGVPELMIQPTTFPTGEDGEIGGEFWAQAAADNVGPGPDDMDNGFPAPFATQFFHDEDDDGGFDDGDGGIGDMPAADEEDFIAATQGTLKRVRPEHINYAKRAKRVDVRMLKENIWKGLNIVVPKGNMEDEHEEVRHLN